MKRAVVKETPDMTYCLIGRRFAQFANELAGWNEVVVKPYVMVRIPNLAVDQAPRGRGIARKLIGYALEYFRCERLTL